MCVYIMEHEASRAGFVGILSYIRTYALHFMPLLSRRHLKLYIANNIRIDFDGMA